MLHDGDFLVFAVGNSRQTGGGSVLTTARQIYADAGYVLVRTEVHDTFGKPLTAETWELTL